MNISNIKYSSMFKKINSSPLQQELQRYIHGRNHLQLRFCPQKLDGIYRNKMQ